MALTNSIPSTAIGTPYFSEARIDNIDIQSNITDMSADTQVSLSSIVDVIGYFSVSDGNLILDISKLPTSDPGVKGALWNNGTFFAISQG